MILSSKRLSWVTVQPLTILFAVLIIALLRRRKKKKEEENQNQEVNVEVGPQGGGANRNTSLTGLYQSIILLHTPIF